MTVYTEDIIKPMFDTDSTGIASHEIYKPICTMKKSRVFPRNSVNLLVSFQFVI